MIFDSISLNMSKQSLRKQALNARAALSENDFQNASQQIADNFFKSTDLSKINVIHTFLPVLSRKEPNTWLIINEIRATHPAIKISIPKISGAALKNYFFEGVDQLEVNSFGISEPKQGIETANQEIDLVLVPLLAADTKGNRLGYGKGFYDRFLVNCRNDCLKCGLSLFKPIDTIPTEPHDIQLNQLITPRGIISFR